MSADQPTAEHPALFADSVLIEQVARALHHAICAQQTIPPDWDGLSAQEQHKLTRAAKIAFFGLNPSIAAVGIWRAAQVLGFTRYARDWPALTSAEQRACRLEASSVIAGWEIHLQRLNPEQVERSAVRIATEAIARTQAKRAGQTDDSPDGFYDLACQLARREGARVVPIRGDA